MAFDYSVDHIDPDDYVSFSKAIAHRTPFNQSSVFDLDDATGASAEALWKAIKVYDPERGIPIKPYVSQRMRWGIIGEYRKQFPYAHDRYDSAKDQLYQMVDLDGEVGGDLGDYFLLRDTIPDGNTPDWASSIDIRDAIQQLSPKQQQLIKLKYWDCLEHQDIADIMGIKMGTIDVYLKRAYKKLRLIMDGGKPRVHVMPGHGRRFKKSLTF